MSKYYVEYVIRTETGVKKGDTFLYAKSSFDVYVMLEDLLPQAVIERLECIESPEFNHIIPFLPRKLKKVS